MTWQVSRFCSETHTIPSRIVTWCEKNMSKFPHFPTPAAYILRTFHSFNLKKSPLSISLQSPNRMLACLLLGDQSTGLIWNLRLRVRFWHLKFSFKLIKSINHICIEVESAQWIHLFNAFVVGLMKLRKRLGILYHC